MYRICVRNVAGKMRVFPKRYETIEKAQARLDSMKKEIAEIEQLLMEGRTEFEAWIIEEV